MEYVRLLRLMVIVKYKGRLGNNLFQYAHGRIMAEEDPGLGMLMARPIPGFPKTRESVGNFRGGSDTIVDGFFQEYGLFSQHKKKIEKWFKFSQLPPQPEDKLIIHVRLDDYLTGDHKDWIVPMDFYHRLIEIDKPTSVCFVTDEPNYPALRQFDAEIVSEDTLHDFAFLASAKRLCIANSTFSWWAGWLGNAERIYYPDMKIDYFNNLWVHNENRYVRINV